MKAKHRLQKSVKRPLDKTGKPSGPNIDLYLTSAYNITIHDQRKRS